MGAEEQQGSQEPEPCEPKPKQAGQWTIDGGVLEDKIEENREPEGDILTYLDYFGLTENPTISRDFVHTELVNRLTKLIRSRERIRLLGEAGIGKSATIREIKTRLEQDPREKYIVVPIAFNRLVDYNSTHITKDGLATIGLYALKVVDEYFDKEQEKSKHKRKSIPDTEEDIVGLKKISDSIGLARRMLHLASYFEKALKSDYKIVVILDDADALQSFEDFNNLNDLIDMAYSTVISYKPAEEAASKQRACIREAGELFDEVKARQQKQAAFWRRTTSITIEGQPADVTLKILRGKISKREELLTDEAIAYGLMAAYCGKTPGADSLAAYTKFGLRPNQLLYNPSRIGYFLASCLETAYRRKVTVAPGCIDASIAERACRATIYNLAHFSMVDAPSLEDHLRELQLAREQKQL